MGVPPVIIHFRLAFSMKSTIQLLGVPPLLGKPHISHDIYKYCINYSINCICTLTIYGNPEILLRSMILTIYIYV